MLWPYVGKYYAPSGTEPKIPPIVRDDPNLTAVVGGGSVTLDITANDTFSGPKSGLTVTLDTSGLTDSAAAVVDGNNDVTFTPSASQSTQSFSYTIEDDTGLTSESSATVTVSVQASAPETGWATTIPYVFAAGAVDGQLDGPTPIPFDVTEPDLRTVGNGGSVTSASGHDIRMESSGQQRVFFQRDSYDAATGQLTGWLRLPAGTDQTGLAINILAGKANHPDESSAVGVWGDPENGYIYAGRSDGSNRVPGKGSGFTLGTGISTASGEQDAMLFDGTADARTTAFDGSWPGGPKLSSIMKVRGDNTFGTSVGWLSLERDDGGYEYMYINLAESSGFNNLWVAVTQVGEAWGGWRGVSNSAFGGPNTITAVWDVAESFTKIIRDGIVPDNGPTNAWGAATALNPINNNLVLGHAAQGTYWAGLVGCVHLREREHSPREHLLLARMLWRGPSNEKWVPFIPSGDALAVPPFGDELTPPDPIAFPGE